MNRNNQLHIAHHSNFTHRIFNHKRPSQKETFSRNDHISFFSFLSQLPAFIIILTLHPTIRACENTSPSPTPAPQHPPQNSRNVVNSVPKRPQLPIQFVLSHPVQAKNFRLSKLTHFPPPIPNLIFHLQDAMPK